MRPFKLFFALSMGIILFLFFAKIVFIALVMAFVMSIVFGVFKKAKRLIKGALWEDDERDYYYTEEHSLPVWKEDLFTEKPVRGVVYLNNHRSIVVR